MLIELLRPRKNYEFQIFHYLHPRLQKTDAGIILVTIFHANVLYNWGWLIKLIGVVPRVSKTPRISTFPVDWTSVVTGGRIYGALHRWWS